MPDPEVAKLMARIRAKRPADKGSCLAILTSGKVAGGWRTIPTEARYVEGARERAREYGYRLDEFWMGEPEMTSKRLGRIIWSRGIEGVVVAPLQERLEPGRVRSIDLDFSQFAAVEISETIDRPDLDRAIHDQYTSMLKALSALEGCGYSRIGLVLDTALDVRTNGKWTAAFLRRRMEAASDWPAPLLLDGHEKEGFSRWFARSRPDAIVSVDGLGLALLRASGIKIPSAVGYASLDLDGDAEQNPGISGIDQNSRLVGAAAIDMLVAMIQRGQRGVPAHPVRTEVEGDWIDGSTTRKAKPRRAPARPRRGSPQAAPSA